MLNLQERTTVHSMAEIIRRAAVEAAEEEGLIRDLQYLRREITLSLGMYWKVFATFAKLLSAETCLYDPEDAYRAGRNCTASDLHEGYRAYWVARETDPEIKRYYAKLQSLYNWLILLLGHTGQSDLLRDYLAEYREAYSAVKGHTFDFFAMGFQSGRQA